MYYGEPRLSRFTRVLGLLTIAFCAGCSASLEPVLPTSIQPPVQEVTPTSVFTPDSTPTPIDAIVPTVIATEIAPSQTPPAPPTPTPTEGVFELWPVLQEPTVTAMAQNISATMEAGSQVELAKNELPDWYMQNVVSIVFKDNFKAGFTGLRLDPKSFVDNGAPNPNYEYYLLVKHADEVQDQFNNMVITDVDGNKSDYSKDDWKFVSDPSGMGILAIKKPDPVSGVSKSQFINLDEWDPASKATTKAEYLGLCFPYPDPEHPYRPWFVKQTLNDHPTIRYGGTWQLAFDGQTAAAASGCPLYDKTGQRVVAVMEGFYSLGSRAIPIDKEAIGSLISGIISN